MHPPLNRLPATDDARALPRDRIFSQRPLIDRLAACDKPVLARLSNGQSHFRAVDGCLHSTATIESAGTRLRHGLLERILGDHARILQVPEEAADIEQSWQPSPIQGLAQLFGIEYGVKGMDPGQRQLLGLRPAKELVAWTW